MIDAVLRHQIGVGALLCNGAAVQNQNPIGINNARQAMRKDQGRPPAHQPIKRFLNNELIRSINS